MRYLLVVAFLMAFGCSQIADNSSVMPDNSPIRQTQLSPGLKDFVLERYYHQDCAPPEIIRVWDNVYNLIDGNSYEAFNWVGTPGDIQINRSDFEGKDIDGYWYEYQYGAYLGFEKQGNKYQPQILVVWSEPLGNFARRVKVNYCNVTSSDNAWFGSSNYIMPGNEKPSLYFMTDEQSNSNCCIDWTKFQDTYPNITGANVNDVTMLYGKLYAISYNSVLDSIHCMLYIQCEYQGEPFIQIWTISFETS